MYLRGFNSEELPTKPTLETKELGQLNEKLASLSRLPIERLPSFCTTTVDRTDHLFNRTVCFYFYGVFFFSSPSGRHACFHFPWWLFIFPFICSWLSCLALLRRFRRINFYILFTNEKKSCREKRKKNRARWYFNWFYLIAMAGLFHVPSFLCLFFIFLFWRERCAPDRLQPRCLLSFPQHNLWYNFTFFRASFFLLAHFAARRCADFSWRIVT